MPPLHRVEVAIDPAYERRVDAALIRAAVIATLISRRLRRPRSVSVTLTGTRAVRRLNRRYLGLDEATDVLSFVTEFPGLRRPDGAVELGAIIVAAPVAARGARARGVTWADELALLVCHGTLHLLGFDHATRREDAAMRALECAALSRLGRPQATR